MQPQPQADVALTEPKHRPLTVLAFLHSCARSLTVRAVEGHPVVVSADMLQAVAVGTAQQRCLTGSTQALVC